MNEWRRSIDRATALTLEQGRRCCYSLRNAVLAVNGLEEFRYAVIFVNNDDPNLRGSEEEIER